MAISMIPQSSTLLLALGALVAYGLTKFIIAFRLERGRVKGLPGPPRSAIWGHAVAMRDVQLEAPPDVHPHTLPALIGQKYNLRSFFYLDFWPFAPSALVVTDPEIAEQLLHVGKHWSLAAFMDWIAGPENLVTSHGESWRIWRSIFNPGFASSYLTTLIPIIVEETSVFCNILRENAKTKTLFRLEEAVTRLTVDVITRASIDVRADNQQGDTEFLKALKRQINVLDFMYSPNPLARYNPVPWIKLIYNDWIMKTYIRKVLHDRYEYLHSNKTNGAKRRMIIDLALETYMAEQKKEGVSRSGKLDPTFERYAIAQLRTFIFAGHDTTSSTICYALYLLENHDDVRAKVMAEHDRLFGPDPEAAEDVIREKPHLINKLEYTNAVIKETLRMYPPASSIRASSEPITDPKTGITYPTDGFMVWILHQAIFRDPQNFPDPHTFRPERFLSGPESAPYAPLKENSWRPFERGPRNCIGQELSLIELRVVLVSVLRRFKVRTAYEEVMSLQDDGMGWPKYESEKDSKKSVWGDQAYQTLRGSAKPRQGMPVRIELR